MELHVVPCFVWIFSGFIVHRRRLTPFSSFASLDCFRGPWKTETKKLRTIPRRHANRGHAPLCVGILRCFLASGCTEQLLYTSWSFVFCVPLEFCAKICKQHSRLGLPASLKMLQKVWITMGQWTLGGF